MAHTRPDLLIGLKVQDVEKTADGDLMVSFVGTDEILIIRAPWTFASCLGGESSEAAVESFKPPSELLPGFEGAELTGLDKDNHRTDLKFGSIVISTEKIISRRST